MQDEDEYIIKYVIKNVGCIPTYWRQFAGSIGLNQTIPTCKSTMDYGKVRTQIVNIMENINTLDTTHKLQCTRMMISVAMKDNTDDVKAGMARLELWYHGTSYKEITNTKAYTSETLLGQVGGFVGM